MRDATMRTVFHSLMLVVALTFVLNVFGVAQPIRINGGNQTMTISTGIAGGQPISVLNTACSLQYTKQSKISKITVATSCPGQSFELSVLATNVTRGTAAPTVSLANGNPAMDLVTNIPRTGFTSATCTLNFTASATFSQGNSTELGNDVHSITYTILAQ
jgi:hypothetical protein